MARGQGFSARLRHARADIKSTLQLLSGRRYTPLDRTDGSDSASNLDATGPRSPERLFCRTEKLVCDVTNVAHWVRLQGPRLLRVVNPWDRAQMSLGRTLAEKARAIPDQAFVLWEGRTFSYGEVHARVTQIAAALYSCGIRRGVAVGLLMENHPDCLIALAALSRLGAVPVLINPAARGTVLSHAMMTTGVRQVILGPQNRELTDTGSARRLLIGQGCPAGSAAAGAVDLDAIFAELPADVEPDPGRAADIAFLMFTSGTTGKPKAVKISNRRWLMAATAAAAGCGLTAEDTVYCCLPLYHGTGLLLAASGALVGGCRLALAPRFSARSFWEDVHRTFATVVFYVGELCRYLFAMPASPLEKTHRVRLFVGNGMRVEVWRQLLARCGHTSVLEFYAATEGNVMMANLTGEKIGSIGRVPFGLLHTQLVKYDSETESYPRDHRGFLIPAPTGTPGMLIVEISAHNPFSRFDGYTDRAATEHKILRDVFRKGDAWFSSGDLLRQDEDGDHFFLDRVGDTFRFKSENVSTEQVAGVLASLPFVEACAVYGVRLPNQEGRAGMAAIQLRPSAVFLPEALFAAVEQNLFDAARPRFVRIVLELMTTETMKIIKHSLEREGIDIEKTGPLYMYDKSQRTYTLVTKEELAARLPSL